MLNVSLRVFGKPKRPELLYVLVRSSRSLVRIERGHVFHQTVVKFFSGYGVLDGFLEGDTFLHSWEMLARIIDHQDCQDIVVDVGMPVRHRNVRYNCR